MLGLLLRLAPAFWACLGEAADHSAVTEAKVPFETKILVLSEEAGRLLASITAAALDPESDFSSSGALATASKQAAAELKLILEDVGELEPYWDLANALRAFSEAPLTWPSTVQLGHTFDIWRTISTERWFQQLMDVTGVMFALLFCPSVTKAQVPDTYEQLVVKGSVSIAGDGMATHVMRLSELRGRHTCDRTCLLNCATSYAALALHAAHAENVGDVARFLDAAQDMFLTAGIFRLGEALTLEAEQAPTLSALWGLLAALSGTTFMQDLDLRERRRKEVLHLMYPKVVPYALPERNLPCPKASLLAPLPPGTALDLYRMVDTVGQVLSWHGVVWFASHGTLLGALRHQGIIPHDCDVDFTLTEDEAKLLMSTPVMDSLLRNGYEVAFRPVQNLFAIFRLGARTEPAGWQPQGYIPVEPHMDIYVLYRCGEGDQTYFEYMSNLDIHRGFTLPTWSLFPTRSAAFGSSAVRVPAHPEIYLDAMYGDWKDMVRPMSARVDGVSFAPLKLDTYHTRGMAMPAGPLREVLLPAKVSKEETPVVDAGMPDSGK